MRLMRRRPLLALSAAVLATAGRAADAPPRQIRFGYGLNEQSNQGRAVRHFAEAVRKASAGRLQVVSTGAASLGADTQMQQALISGSQEMMVGSTATLAGLTPEMALWDTPFLFASAAEADAVLDGPVGQKVMARLQDQGLVGLVYWENGFRHLTNSLRPVQRLEDLAGMRLRVMQNNIYLNSFRLLGASAVPLPFSELYAALGSQAVQGQENPVNTILSSRLYQVQKYLSVTSHVYSPWIVLASKKWWDGLSRDEQRLLLDAAVRSRDFERADTRAEAARALNDLRARGMQVNQVPPAEVARMRDRLTRVNASIGASVGMGLWNDTQVQLETLRVKRAAISVGAEAR